MKAIAIIFILSFSLAVMAWEVGDVITTNYSWTDSNGETQFLHDLTASGKTVFWFQGADWSPSSTTAAEILNDWLPEQNPDSLYFCGTFDWSNLGYNNLPYSNELDLVMDDFSNGYSPLFVVIGNYNVLFYQDNFLDEVLNVLPDAYNSFTNMFVLNPIEDQIMFIGDQSVFDVTDLFIDPQGDDIDISVSNNTNPAVISALVLNDSLYLEALSEGISDITIMGETSLESIEYTFTTNVYDINENYILLIDLAGSSNGDSLASLFEDIYPGGNVFMANDWNVFPMDNADAVCILLGVYNDNYVLTENEITPVVQYLNNGGNLYMEGGDTWAFDTQTTLHSYFKINGISDGNGDLFNVTGGGFLEGMNWIYNGNNSYIDQLEPIGDAFTVFSNPDAGYNCGIAYDSGDYKTVGTSFEISGLAGSYTMYDAVWGIMEFFELVGLPMNPPQNLYVNDWEGIATWEAPDSTVAVGYNVYLDSVFVGYTEELSYQFDSLINGQDYLAGVTALYCEGESEMITYDFTYYGLAADDVIGISTCLKGNFPNPFNPSTEIRFSLAANQPVMINVYNIKGQLVKNLVDTELTAGEHAVVWNGDDEHSKSVASGMYLLQMQTEKLISTRKITLIK